MIWILGYLVIGMGFAIYLPIRMAKTRKSLETVAARRAEMCEHDRELFDLAASTVNIHAKTWQIVIAGLVWPTQILSWLVAVIYVEWLRGRRS